MAGPLLSSPGVKTARTLFGLLGIFFLAAVFLWSRILGAIYFNAVFADPVDPVSGEISLIHQAATWITRSTARILATQAALGGLSFLCFAAAVLLKNGEGKESPQAGGPGEKTGQEDEEDAP